MLVGQAGTGKGVVIPAAAGAWQREGYQVIGTAVAGATAERLGAGREARALDDDRRADRRAENGSVSMSSETVVVMDEAGMADTHRLAGAGRS